MKQKTFNNVRFQLKGDSEENLQKASGFVPLDKELVTIKPDDNNQYARLMVGDGVTNVGDLSVINPQSDWSQDDPTQPDYIKNKPDVIGGGGGTTVTVGGVVVETFNADTKLDKGSLSWDKNALISKDEQYRPEEDGYDDYKATVSPEFIGVEHYKSEWMGTASIKLIDGGVEVKTPVGERTSVIFPVHPSGDGHVTLATNQLAGAGSTDKAGLVYTPNGYWNGINANNGVLTLTPASKSQIDGKSTTYFAITPSNLDYAVNSVVGEDIADHERRLEDLESVLLTYQEDTTQAYEKVVPSAVAPSAILDSIGGESVASKNLYNPNTPFYNGSMPTVNEDGSINYKSIKSGDNLYDGLDLPSIWLDPGTYYVKVSISGTHYIEYMNWWCGDNQSGAETHFTVTLTEKQELGMQPNIYVYDDAEGSVLDVNFYVMVSKTDIPYEPYFEGLRHAPVTELKSQNAQLLDQSLIIQGYMDVNIQGMVGASGYCTFQTYLKAGKYTVNANVKLGGTRRIVDGVASNYGGWSVPFTFDVEKDCMFGFSFNDAPSNLSTLKIMLNRGSEALPYQEFGGLVGTYTIPDGIKSLTNYGKKYTYVDFDNKQFVDNSYTIVLTGKEAMGGYKYGSNVGVIIGGSNAYPYGPSGSSATNTPYVSNEINSAWVARYGQLWWLNALTAYGYNKDWVDKTNPTSEESSAAIAQLKADIAERYANGNPVVVTYKVGEGTTTDISQYLTDYDDFKLFRVQAGGTVICESEHKVAPNSTITYVKAKG